MFTIQRIYRHGAQQLQSFMDIAEMNEHLKTHILAAGRKLHKNARAVLDILSRYSCAVTGVSWISVTSIAKKLNVHERTVNRAFERLGELNIGRREVVEWEGTTLHFFVLQPFKMSTDCQQVVNNLSVGKQGVEAASTREQATYFDYETMNLGKAQKLKQEDDDVMIIRRNDGLNAINKVQNKVYTQALENGFDASTAHLMAEVCKDIQAPVTAVNEAFLALEKRITNDILPPVTFIPAYFARLLPDVANRLIIRMRLRLRKMQEQAKNVAEAKTYTFYNWLEGES